MKKIFSQIKESLFKNSPKEELESDADEYVELDTSGKEEIKSKIIIRPFTLEDFADVKSILDTIRTGNTIALINIKTLKEKDLVELKRAINKLKKTCDAIDGDIAGFGDDWLVCAPSFAEIYRNHKTETIDDSN